MNLKPIKFLLLAVFSLAACIASAQKKAAVSGHVKDSLQKPMAYVTASLFKEGQMQQPLKTTYTNDKGRFQFSSLDSGSYVVVLSHSGFAEKQQNVTVAGADQDLGSFSLSPATANLQGVVVTARKPLIEQADDKIVFNVENDPASKTENAIDLLRKTPFVSVDGDNNIQVNGQTNFKVLLNGRETAMFAQNVKEALKGFPGALITKIEVITTPSAKYDAEGVGGIINIITKKKVAGYNGSVSAYFSSIDWGNINANFSAKFGKLGATVYYGAGGNTKDQWGSNFSETIPFTPTIFTRRTLEGARKFGNFWNFGNAEFSYEIDSLNTLSTYGNISGGNNRQVSDQTFTTDFSNGTSSTSYFDLTSRNEYPTKSVGTDYIRKFSNNKEREFSVRLNGEFGNSNSFLNSVQDNPGTDRFIINNSKAVNRQYTIQSDYIHPLANSRKIEAGVKGILRRARSDFESFIRYSPAEEYKVNPANTDNFSYTQDVYSVYGTYSFKKNKTTFRLGARLEHTEIDGDFSSSKSFVKQSYTSILPNLQATTKFSNSYTLVTSYSQRLQRPFIWNLNPFVNNNDSLNIFYGNPELAPQTIHSISAQNRIMKGTTFASLTLTASYSDDMIVQYATFDKATGVTRTTSANLGEEMQVSLNGNVNLKITPDWSVFFNGNVRYNRVRNKEATAQVNSGVGGNGNLNTSYTFKKKLVLSGYAGFWRGPVSIQTSYPLNIWYGAGAGYKFFKDKVTASLMAANFLSENWDYRMVTTDPSFQTTNITTMPFRALALSLTWNFGKLTENVSKKKGVTNDDLIGGGQGN